MISVVFVRVKKDGGHRMILNLKNLNKYANKLYFKMDTLNTIIKLVEKDCFMASTDLKDAYYSVPIATSHRKCLRFFWREQLYQFTCLPNGLSCGPRKAIFKTRNGESGNDNGERGTGNGERGTGNGERGTGNGESLK